MWKFRDAVHHALEGIGFAFTNERSLRYQFAIFLIAIVAGLYFQISSDEFLAILLISCLVFSLELINTAIEKSMDIIGNGEYSEKIKIVKDISAGAVLLAACFAAFVGITIFLPRLMELLK